MRCEFTTVERDGPITLITLSRPEVLNALHKPAHLELTAIFEEFAADPSQWVAIVTGAGERAFCAGFDLKAPSDTQSPRNNLVPGSGFGGLTGRFDLTKPVIAAVNGLAFGGGFELALACDVIVAEEHAQFALPEPRVGLVALAGGLLRLTRAIGEKRAMEIVLTARRVGASEAQTLGLVAEVTPRGGAVASARRIAQEICAASPRAIRATKQTVQLGADLPLEAAMSEQWNFPAVKAWMASDDIREGPLAFAQKRTPTWGDA